MSVKGKNSSGKNCMPKTKRNSNRKRKTDRQRNVMLSTRKNAKRRKMSSTPKKSVN